MADVALQRSARDKPQIQSPTVVGESHDIRRLWWWVDGQPGSWKVWHFNEYGEKHVCTYEGLTDLVSNSQGGVWIRENNGNVVFEEL